jgi:drug/metabolite transporter (DMT)-like permease
VVQVLYFLALGRSYQRADFSTTYPIARGLAPPVVAVLAFAFLDDRLQPLQLVALGVVSAGVLMVASGSVRTGGIRWAAVTGVLIAIYTSIDGAGVRASGESFRYTIFLFWLASSMFLPIVVHRRRWSGIAASLRREGWRYVAAGVASLAAYSLVLVAARSVALGSVAAIREMSVVFGALAGWLLLKEPLVARRLAGTVVITLGVAGLAFR